jgi:hypothetical protein
MRLHNYLRQCGYVDNDIETQRSVRVLTDKEIQQHQRNYTPTIPPDNIMLRRHILQEARLN